MGSVLIVGTALTALGGVDPSHRAVHIVDGIITWTGADPRHAPAADQVHDLGDAWLTPGFVDAHVHGTATGLQQGQLDLSIATGRTDALDRLHHHAAAMGPGVLMGGGWDDSRWDDGGPLTAREIAAAAPDRPVVLVRTDGHSCVVDPTTLDAILTTDQQAAHVHRDEDGRATGWLKEDASATAVSLLRAQLPAHALTSARSQMVRAARALGITTVHEMGIPALSDLDDATIWAAGGWDIAVEVYWADITIDPSGPLRPGGDLFLDGSIGSCTAATTLPYTTSDGGRSQGDLLHDDDQVRQFFARSTAAGVGAGVHAIGDAAIGQALMALEHAAHVHGVDAVRAARHRIEHVELITPTQTAAMARLGVVASVQPAFDAVWNGPGGLYEHRFGRQRADQTNPLRDLADAGVRLCFSSDSPVTPLDPWGGIAAAEDHAAGRSLTRIEALHAATIGGHEVLGLDERRGALLPGREVALVAWPGDPLTEDPSGWTPLHVHVGG